MIDNQTSRERLFYIIYGLDYETSKNDLDFDWNSKNSETQYRSENSEGQLSFGDDKQETRNNQNENKNPEDEGPILEVKPEFGRVKESNNFSQESEKNQILKNSEEKNSDHEQTNLKNSEAFTLGEASKDGSKNPSDIKNLNNLFSDVDNGFNIHSSPENEIKQNFQGLSLQESMQENEFNPPVEKNFERSVPVNVNATSDSL